MITKQRQYKRFEQNLKQALNNVQKYYSAISEMKKDSETITPLQKSKQIHHQKVQAFKTVEDECDINFKQQVKYTSLNPKQKSFERFQMNARKVSKNKQIKEFKMEQSFSNKYNTVKKQYLEHSTLAGGQLAISKEEISLKKTKKEKQHNTLKNKQEIIRINIQEHIQGENNENSFGNGVINLQNGWVYKGQYTNGLFHGFGQLYHNKSLVYSGNFQFGYFNGYGKLMNHKDFNYLIRTEQLVKSIKCRFNLQLQIGEWETYCGEFLKGKIKGFGQLKLKTREKIICSWNSGKIKGNHFTFLDSSSQV